MTKTLTAREANQGFSRILREVEAGEEFLVTRNGAPVARIISAAPGKRVLTPEQEAAWASTLERIARAKPAGIGRFSREEIYDERMDELEERRNRAS